MAIQKNVLILIGVLSLSYIIIFLLSPKDVTGYTIADTDYWRETKNRLLLKTAYNYNDKDSIVLFPKTIGEWKSFDYRYPEFVYTKLNAEILMSRGYTKDNRNVIWMDIISSETGESFHNQRVCVEGAGWNIDRESVVEFKIADFPNSFTKLYANRLDISKKDKKQVMIYWFMFKKFGSSDSVVMTRLSVPVKANETEKTFDHVKDFIENQLFDAMYKYTKEETTMLEYIIDKYGNMGKVVVATVLLIFIGIIAVGMVYNEGT